jgi:SAM-dependent methyltransferase
VNGYAISTFGQFAAKRYDETYADWDATAAVDFLEQHAGGGPVLELGIGTGRVALPLAARGLEVHGIDASEAMLSRLREKPGGADIPVTLGDMADVDVDGDYPLVFVAASSFFGVLCQDDQVRCFQNVARRLTPNGAFVVEVFVPVVTRGDRDQEIRMEQIELNEIRLSIERHDLVNQIEELQYLVVGERGIRLEPVRIRYAWPAELDLMGRLAGLRLAERWSGWDREPFTADAWQHVSVYVPE